MRTIYDGKLYLYFGIATMVLALITGAVSAYSTFVVEPEIRKYLDADSDISKNYKKAYVLLREPQIFAGYDRFDHEDSGVKRFIEHFDEMVYYGIEMTPDQKQYLELLYQRREKGAALGMKTMVYILLVSLLAWTMFFIERRQSSARNDK